jgi:putative spermidine/putrescine transport system ATP-binding protein
VAPDAAGANTLRATVEVVEYQGRELAVEARTPDGLRLHVRTPERLAPGDARTFTVDPARLLVFPQGDEALPEATTLVTHSADEPALAGSGGPS